MLQIFKELDLPVPEGVTVSVSSRVFTVKGPRGSLTKVSIPDYADTMTYPVHSSRSREAVELHTRLKGEKEIQKEHRSTA